MLQKRIRYSFLFLLTVLGLVACGGSGSSAPKLEPPSNVQAVADAGFIKLSWTDNSDNETGFIIYREVISSEANSGITEIAELEADVESFEDDMVDVDKRYRYSVAASNAAGATDPVAQLGPSLSPKPPIENNPPFIAFFQATADAQDPLKVTLSWTISDSDGDPLSCSIDIGDNGSVEYSIDDCSPDDEQEHVFETAGTYTISLSLSDGKDTFKEVIEVTVFISLR